MRGMGEDDRRTAGLATAAEKEARERSVRAPRSKVLLEGTAWVFRANLKLFSVILF